MRIGIDVGGTNIAAGLVDDLGKLVYKTSCPTVKTFGSEKVVCDIINLIKEIKEKNRDSDINFIGMGIPGAVDAVEQRVYACSNVPISGVDIKGIIEKETNIETRIGNDANCAALGELLFGVDDDLSNAIMVTLGTGIGGGIILNKKIYSGVNGSAGEFGHISIKMNGKKCSCGARGCFEQYASATALIEQAKTAMKENQTSALWKVVNGDISAVTGKTVFDAVKEYDDSIAKKVLDKYIDYLSIGIKDLLRCFEPDVVIIGGGISAGKDLILKPLNDKLQKIFSRFKMLKTKIVVAKFGNDAGILGAAFLKD